MDWHGLPHWICMAHGTWQFQRENREAPQSLAGGDAAKTMTQLKQRADNTTWFYYANPPDVDKWLKKITANKPQTDKQE